MNWPLLISIASGLMLASLPTILKWFFSRAESEATVIESQSKALRDAWDRIEELEQEIREIKRTGRVELERLTRENQQLAARVGRLQIQLDQYERSG